MTAKPIVDADLSRMVDEALEPLLKDKAALSRDGWDLAGAIEHSPHVKAVRAMIAETRAAMTPRDRDYEGLVTKAVHERFAARIAADEKMCNALMSWAILHLVEEAEMAAAGYGC